MGGSLGLALRSSGVCVTGFDTDPSVREKARSLGLVDETAPDLAAAIEGADLAVVAVPAASVPLILHAIARLSRPPALVTDLASTKEGIVASWSALPEPKFPFVGGHPVAGTERSGPEAARPDLYRGALVVLTPLTPGDPGVGALTALWEALGARVALLDPATHDRLMAKVSHLPHVAAYALVHSLLEAEPPEVLETFVAGGFKDFTRITASSPVMWRDICIANAGPLLTAVDAYRRHLDDLRGLIEAGDAAGLEAYFGRARDLRCRIVPDGGGPGR
jgi:prephenate dehydrogenase